MVEIKFCGLTRAEDVATAQQLGAAYLGVIFAGGPRLRTPEQARALFGGVPDGGPKRVGVFGAQSDAEILAVAESAGLDVLQLTYGAERERRIGLRSQFAGEIWAVAHVPPSASVPADTLRRWYDDGIDAIVLDAAVPGQLGGTGVRLSWTAIADDVAALRASGRVLLAGGLRPENVAEALAAVVVDAVDVSSGVESAPGIKDPERMRAFAAAVRAHEVR